MELDEIVRETTFRLIYDQDEFTGGQEPTPINSEQIDDEKSDEQSHQFIESTETEILLMIYSLFF